MIYLILFLNIAFSSTLYECPSQSNEFAASIAKLEEKLLSDADVDEETKLLFTEYSFSSNDPFAFVYRGCAIYLSDVKNAKSKKEIHNYLKLWGSCLAGLNHERNHTAEKIFTCWDKIK